MSLCGLMLVWVFQEGPKKESQVSALFISMFIEADLPPGWIYFLGLLWQITKHGGLENRNLSSHSSGGQESEIKMEAGPHFLQSV